MLDDPNSFKRRTNPGQKSLGQYCNIHIFLSFLGSLLKQCILFEIFLQFSLPPPYTKLKLGKILDTRVQHCLRGEGRGWTYVNWKTLQKRKSVPRLLSMIVGLKKTHKKNVGLIVTVGGGDGVGREEVYGSKCNLKVFRYVK